MSAETLRRAAALMRERETEPWKLAVADLLEGEAHIRDARMRDHWINVDCDRIARTYLGESA